jgi:hypothetical protein
MLDHNFDIAVAGNPGRLPLQTVTEQRTAVDACTNDAGFPLCEWTVFSLRHGICVEGASRL